MKILFVVPYVPNLIRSRSYNLIRSLTRLGEQVTVATLTTSEEDEADVVKLREVCHQVISLKQPSWQSLVNAGVALPTRKPLQSVYSWKPELLRLINDRLFDRSGYPAFDVIHLEHLRSVHYGIGIKRHLADLKKYIPVVWDSVDCISYLFRQSSTQSSKWSSRLITGLELKRTEAYEGMLVDEFDHVLVTSKKDRQAFLDLVSLDKIGDKISVLPSGVDLEYFSPNPAQHREEKSLVVTGKMSYHANVSMAMHMCNEIMPRVWMVNPEVCLWIVGKDPPKEVISLAEHPRVNVTGMVADLRPYLENATISVAPLTYGAGIQNKVLEAMACATPVVSTQKAVSALSIEPGKEAIVAESPDEFARAVLDLLCDPERRQAVGKAGRAYVEKFHSWESIAAKLDAIYASVSFQI